MLDEGIKCGGSCRDGAVAGELGHRRSSRTVRRRCSPRASRARWSRRRLSRSMASRYSMPLLCGTGRASASGRRQDELLGVNVLIMSAMAAAQGRPAAAQDHCLLGEHRADPSHLGDRPGSGGCLFQADLLPCLRKASSPSIRAGVASVSDVTVRFRSRRCTGTHRRKSARGCGRVGRCLPRGLLLGVFDVEVTRLGRHATDAAVHTAVQRSAPRRCLAGTPRPARRRVRRGCVVVAVDGQRITSFSTTPGRPGVLGVAELLP